MIPRLQHLKMRFKVLLQREFAWWRERVYRESRVALFAIRGGKTNVLLDKHLARANGCHLSTCRYAEVKGHLAVLECAKKNGCSLYGETVEIAARHGGFLDWAIDNGYWR